jgi:phosphoglycolate phosphatase-like HAD superfamily hydrolase
MRNTALVFDFDGTLIDTIPVKIESYARATIEEFGVDPAKRPLITQTQFTFGGAPKFVQIAETVRVLGIAATEEQIQSWARRYTRYNDENTPRCPEFPVVREMLADLGRRFDLFLTSGLPHAGLSEDARHRKLAGFFLELRGDDKTAFLRELKARGYRHVIIVGDGKYDGLAARDSGGKFLFVRANEDLKRVWKRLRDPAFDPAALVSDPLEPASVPTA